MYTQAWSQRQHRAHNKQGSNILWISKIQHARLCSAILFNTRECLLRGKQFICIGSICSNYPSYHDQCFYLWSITQLTCEMLIHWKRKMIYEQWHKIILLPQSNNIVYRVCDPNDKRISHIVHLRKKDADKLTPFLDDLPLKIHSCYRCSPQNHSPF